MNDVKINRERLRQIKIQSDLQLMAAKISLITFLERKYGPKNYSRWLQYCQEAEGKMPLMVQNYAIKEVKEQLEAK